MKISVSFEREMITHGMDYYWNVKLREENPGGKYG